MATDGGMSGRVALGACPLGTRSRIFCRLALVALLLLAGFSRPGPSPGPLTYHVAPNGDDANPGTLERPFASLERARKAVRRDIAKGLKQDVLVSIRGGRYGLTGPLIFGPEDSGTPAHKVTYAAYPGESPIISGGAPLPPFTERGDGVWIAPLPKGVSLASPPRELFVNNRRAQRARQPNSGYLRVAEPGTGGHTGFSYNAGDLAGIADAAEIELVLLHDWSVSRKPVASVDATTLTITLRSPLSSAMDRFRIDKFEPHPRYFLENSADFLDAPGEWHASRDQVQYVPLKGEVAGTTEATVPVSPQLLVLRGDLNTGRPVHDIVFRGLTFRHTRWDLPPQGYSEVQAAFFDDRDEQRGTHRTTAVPAAIDLVLAGACRFEQIRIDQVGGSGIWFGRGTTNSGLFDSDIEDIAANGVMVGEDASRGIMQRAGTNAREVPPAADGPVQLDRHHPAAANAAELEARLQGLLQRYTDRHPEVIAIRNELATLRAKTPAPSPAGPAQGRARPTSGPWWQVAPEQAASGNRIENNTIRAAGQIFYGAVGVWVGLANHTTVAQNSIDHLPYTGISVGWMWSDAATPAGHNLIERNDIHDVMQTLSDGGAIYTLGRQPGTLVRGNLIHSIPTAAGRAESNGVFIDEGSSDLRFEDNAVFAVAQSPFRLHRASNIVIRNNLLAVSAGQVAYRYNDTDPATIDHTPNRVVSEGAELSPDMFQRELAKFMVSVKAGRSDGGR